MADLKERLRDLDRIRVPNLHDELSRPRLAPRSEVRTVRRLVTVGVALAVAAAGFTVAIRAFDGDRPPANDPDSTLSVTPKANGSISFRVDDGEGGSRIEAVEPDGTGRRVVFGDDSMGVTQLAWSPDGSRIAYRNPIAGERGIYVANADGTDAVRLTDGANDGWPSWSPDGTKIVFSSSAYDATIEHCDGLPGQEFLCLTDVYSMQADGSDVTRLTRDEVAEFQPAWSPDGSRIAFVRSEEVRNGYLGIFTMNPDGSDVRPASSSAGGSDFAPTWSPDGSMIAFIAGRWEDWAIWVVNADGTDEHQISDALGSGANRVAWSPDGSLITYACVPDGADEAALCLISPDGSQLESISQIPWEATDIAWQPVALPGVNVPEVVAVDSIQVGEDVRSVAYGEGSAWVAVSNNDGSFAGRILRIDPESHAIQADIPVDVIPTWEVGGGAMVVADGSVWVTGGLERPGDFDDPGGGVDAAVIRIDAESEQVVQTFELGGDVGADLAFLDGDLWVLLFGDETVDHSMEVVRVDPTSGTVLARIPLTASWAHRIVSAAGRLVVIEGGDDAVNVGGHLTSIDPATNAVAARTDLQSANSPHGPVVWRDQIWAAVRDGFSRFDPVSAQLVDRSPPLDPSRSSCCGFLEADDRGIWFLGFDGRSGGGERFLDLFDPDTGEVRDLLSLSGNDNPVAMAVAPGGVWILNYDGTLTHVVLS